MTNFILKLTEDDTAYYTNLFIVRTSESGKMYLTEIKRGSFFDEYDYGITPHETAENTAHYDIMDYFMETRGINLAESDEQINLMII